MTTTSLPRYAVLGFLAACTPAGSTADGGRPMEDWRREAIEQQKSLIKGANDEVSVNQAGMLTDVLENPDPPASPRPELPTHPATGEEIAWPVPREGTLTVRYRID